MRHDSLPLTMTPEQLADYIRSNRVDTFNHTEKIPLTEDEINKLAMESSLASRQITKLTTLKKDFEAVIKKGTPWDSNIGEDGDFRPITFTIPPSKGIEKLEANRLFADTQIDLGYREDITAIYLLPYPEYNKMLAVDIEGNEWRSYSRQMSQDEVRQHGKPILSAGRQFREDLAEDGMSIDGIDESGATVLKVGGKKKPKKDLLDDDDDQPI